MGKTLTYEDFENLVRGKLKYNLPNVSDKEFDKYMNDAETQDIIRKRYEDGLEKYKNGEITYKVFTIGCASSAAYCLDLLYDGSFDVAR